jgi:hypothetical protein
MADGWWCVSDSSSGEEAAQGKYHGPTSIMVITLFLHFYVIVFL